MNFWTAAPLAIGAYELTLALRRMQRRKETYKLALRRAQEMGRPLIVVGDPKSGLHTRIVDAYGCGDLCVDLFPCSCPHSLQADITRHIPLEDNSAVVFASCVLEYVDDVQSAWSELHRIAGADENLFVVAVDPWSLTAFFFPGAKWRILSAPPTGPFEAVPTARLLPGAGHL